MRPSPSIARIECISRDCKGELVVLAHIPANLSLEDTDWQTLFHLYEKPLVRVRPDQHVAWHGSEVPDDTGRLLDTLSGR